MRRQAALLAASIGLALPFCAWLALAVAAPVDVVSEKLWLRALDRNETAGVSDVVRDGQRFEDAFLASTSTACRKALASIFVRSQISTAAADEVRAEARADLFVASNALLLAPLARLKNTLSKLRWSSPRLAAAAARYVAAEHAKFMLHPSDLCADARALVANPHAVPPGTARLFETISRLSNADIAAGNAMGRKLGRFATRAEVALVKDLINGVKHIGSVEDGLASAELKKLRTILAGHVVLAAAADR